MPPWRFWCLTRSELTLVFRAARARREHEHDMATYVAWRTADLMRSKKVPRLSRLLRKVKRLSAAEQDRVRERMAEAEAYWRRVDAEAARSEGR